SITRTAALFVVLSLSYTADARAFEQGGSNYTLYQNCDGDPLTLSPPDEFENCRTVIGDYHLDPTRVRSQLQEMCANGQHIIALIAWIQE
ncbi:hypothetical protein, partial [Enterococcus casseliflavus]|uniref:hypothetical protein n=1 Tax=Enterococcus casseliflavus TaxID=37734 RepID=UPI003D0A1352